MLYPDYAIKINGYARFLQIPKAYASHIGKNVFYKLFYPYLISPYKKKKKNGEGEYVPPSSRAVRIFSVPFPYG